LLSDRDIVRAIKDKNLLIEPFDREMVQSCSIDMRLAPEYRTFRYAPLSGHNGILDVGDLKEDHTELCDAADFNGVIALPPGGFILGSSVEYFEFGLMLGGRVEGKSSLGRLGLSVHETAGFFDPGFQGNCTFEIKNNQPAHYIYLRAGMKIAQMAFHRLTSVPERSYAQIGHYSGQRGPTESRYKLS
jgi:dCTP deaminase